MSAFRSTPIAGEVDVADGAPNRVGFIVSKAVGNAVVRNKVKRRLRAIMAEELREGSDTISANSGSLIVLRALPASAAASWSELKTDVHDGLASAWSKGGRRG